MSTASQGPARRRRSTSLILIAARGDLRQRRQERRVPAPERVQARRLDRASTSAASTSRINKAVLYLVLASGLTIAAMIWIARRMQTEAEQGADGGRGRLRPDPQQHHRRQPRRQAGREVVPVPGHALLLHLVLEHASATCRCRPTPSTRSTSSGSRCRRFAIYAATANISIPLVLTLVVWYRLQPRGDPGQGLLRLLRRRWLPPGLEDMNPFGKALDLRDRGDLALRAADLALRATVRQHPRRPPAAAVHGRRAGGAARPRGARAR